MQIVGKTYQFNSNVTKRLFTGFILAAIIFPLILIGHLGLLAVLLLLNFLALKEFYRLFTNGLVMPRKNGAYLFSSMAIILFHAVMAGYLNWKFLGLIGLGAFLFFVSELYRKAENPFYNLGFTFLGLFIISLPIVFFDANAFLPFKEFAYDLRIILGYFLILWAGDSAAYFIGNLVGKFKLFRRISPGKTWEGSIAGLIASLLLAIFNAWLLEDRPVFQWLVIAVIIVVTGTFGDLIKSMMKRSLHVKDTGTILPGHGGILDRFDTLLGSAPFVFLYLLLENYA